MKKFITWLITIIKSFFTRTPVDVVDTKYDTIRNNDVQFENDWTVESQVVNVESNCLKVVYREKYGDEITVYCMVVFRNDKTQQYKFVAPWLKNEIERSNITGISVTEIPKVEKD